MEDDNIIDDYAGELRSDERRCCMCGDVACTDDSGDDFCQPCYDKLPVIDDANAHYL
jgi:hypothetical protein